MPLGLQVAVQGSCSKIDTGTQVKFKYKTIKENHYFDIINISKYNIILGIPWMFQYKAYIGINPLCLVVGCDDSQPITGSNISNITSKAIKLTQQSIDKAQQVLIAYIEPLCKTANKTELSLFRAINRMLPLIDKNKIYSWRESQDPEALRSQ